MLQEGVYILKTNVGTFDVEISEGYSKRIYIKVGKPAHIEGPCIEMHIRDKKKAQMTNVMYDIRCTNERNMAKGVGTQTMLISSFNLIFKYFPDVHKIKFHDASVFEYASAATNKPTSLSLIHHYMLLHGKSWYQEKLGAKPAKSCRDNVKQWVTKLSQTPDKKTLKRLFADVLSIYFDQEATHPCYSYDTITLPSSYHDLFKTLKQSCGIRLFEKIQDDIMIFFNLPSLIYTEWYIPRKYGHHQSNIDLQKNKLNLQEYRKHNRYELASSVGGGTQRKQYFGMVMYINDI
jgi:hypothetical protein